MGEEEREGESVGEGEGEKVEVRVPDTVAMEEKLPPNTELGE